MKKENAMKGEFIYRVRFHEPPLIKDGNYERDFFFFSIKAIYDRFTPDQIGCQANWIWRTKFRAGEVFEGKKVAISRHPCYRTHQTNKKQ